MPSFNHKQIAHIDSYLDDYEAKVHEFDPKMKGRVHAIGLWTREAATEIMKSSLFDDKLVFEGEHTLKWWLDQVVR